MTATLEDVARLAGVSKSTVSNVVRGSSQVAADTRARVDDAVRQLGYRPNGIARALRERVTRVLGLVVPDQANPVYAEMALGAERRARQEGYGLLVVNSACDLAAERSQVDALVERRVDGVLIAGLCAGSRVPDTLAERGTPVVLLGLGAPSDPRIGSVDCDDEAAMDAVVSHLAELGHRRVAFARQHVVEAGGERRLVAFTLAVARRGMELVELDEQPSAIAAHNDIVAIELLDQLERQGLRVPEDISIVGFDDVPLASHARIELTTVHTDAVALGARGVELALAPARRRAERELLPWRLVVRGSTGAASASRSA